MDKDQSTLYHNHPFHYVSVILKGGYTEKILQNDKPITKQHSFLSIIARSNKVFHRIEDLINPTYTLFITYGNYGWQAHQAEPYLKKDDGIYRRTIRGRIVWSNKINGIWFIGNSNKQIAASETRHSIHQI